MRATLGSHLNAVGHDMGLHALPCSLVPAEAIARWGRRAAAALDPLITTRRPFAPEPLLAFYEEDLATVCRDAWSEASNVVEARAATAAAVPGLDRRLERRIEELRDRARARVCWPSRA